mmetsp:Transcript_24062/g.45287  ORF Transcript_24062/g.45287 Transcript_24062/m.45287 type:complete len:241 (-) Transcript_24062:1849-2571(-)
MTVVLPTCPRGPAMTLLLVVFSKSAIKGCSKLPPPPSSSKSTMSSIANLSSSSSKALFSSFSSSVANRSGRTVLSNFMTRCPTGPRSSTSLFSSSSTVSRTLSSSHTSSLPLTSLDSSPATTCRTVVTALTGSYASKTKPCPGLSPAPRLLTDTMTSTFDTLMPLLKTKSPRVSAGMKTTPPCPTGLFTIGSSVSSLEYAAFHGLPSLCTKVAIRFFFFAIFKSSWMWSFKHLTTFPKAV